MLCSNEDVLLLNVVFRFGDLWLTRLGIMVVLCSIEDVPFSNASCGYRHLLILGSMDCYDGFTGVHDRFALR